MSDPLAEIRAGFFLECEELLESLHDGLAALADAPEDGETINLIFRAVHSIKGGAGAFGLEALVDFAHVYETALDAARGGRLRLDGETVTLFTRAADLLGDLVQASREEGTADHGAIADCARALEALVPGEAAPDVAAQPEPQAGFAPLAISLDLPVEAGPPVADSPVPAAAGFVIHFAPEDALYQSGNEPLHILRALNEMGECRTYCDASALPPLSDLDPEAACLAWRIELHCDCAEEEIREVFDFVADLCVLKIEPLTRLEEDDPPGPVDANASPFAATPDIAPPVVQEKAGHPPPAGPAPDGQEAPEKPAARPSGPPAAASRGTVRVDLDRIDRLVNLVGELVINQAMLSQSVAATGLAVDQGVASGLDEFLQLTRDIQDSVMMIRAQPVKSLFQRMGRIVRETAAETGKNVRLVTEGDATEIDKTVIERLAEPLTHMIRNSVDHGLESPEARRRAGKPERGTVRLTAGHRSGRVVVEIADDGAGIDRARVMETAVSRGLVPEGAQLADPEIDNLLFMPGFSTAREVSNLSGRGVGMDVVRNAIGGLGGQVAVQSTPGEGTVFSVSLPLTLAVQDGMVIETAGQTLVVPLGQIHETMQIGPGDIRPLGAGGRLLRLRDRFVPLLDLARELGYRDARPDCEGAIALVTGAEDSPAAAFVIDAIVEQRQVVIKGLNESYGAVPGISAATILGDGKVALILDAAELASRRAAPGFEPEQCIANTG